MAHTTSTEDRRLFVPVVLLAPKTRKGHGSFADMWARVQETIGVLPAYETKRKAWDDIDGASQAARDGTEHRSHATLTIIPSEWDMPDNFDCGCVHGDTGSRVVFCIRPKRPIR